MTDSVCDSYVFLPAFASKILFEVSSVEKNKGQKSQVTSFYQIGVYTIDWRFDVCIHCQQLH